MTDLDKIRRIAAELRAEIVSLSHKTQTPHLGSALSCVDILVASYWNFLRADPSQPKDPNRDRFILSKGHAALALYAVLSKRGFFPSSLLETFSQEGGRLPEQPSPGSVPGVEVATGSLGHGLSFGLGMAVAGRIQSRRYRVLVLLSDGELDEGSVWEAALFASSHSVENLIAVVDYNQWQATDRCRNVLNLDPLPEKFRSFGWNAVEVDGHALPSLTAALQVAWEGASGKPTVLVAHTVKGKGVSFMEDDNHWHYRIPSAAETTAARRELLGEEGEDAT